MIHIVNKINHKNVYYAFINDLEFEFEVKDDKIIGFIPSAYRNEIKKMIGLCEKQNIML